jgi:hypothetical protein
VACLAIASRSALAIVGAGRRAEYTERGIWAAEQSQAGQDQGADQQDTTAGPEQAHQAPPLARRIGEN